MPTKCSVGGCENFYSKNIPFFDLPSPLKYKFNSEKAKLSKKRRRHWLNSMGIREEPTGVLRICCKHFVAGKPAALEDSNAVDWIPTLHMTERKKNDYYNQKRKDSNKNSHAKEFKVSKNINLNKYLNCKVLLDGNIQCTTFKGTNGSGLTVAQKHGVFTSDNVTIKETAINNTVLRIHLINEDLQDLKSKYKSFRKHTPSRTRRKIQEVSSFGRQIKRKTGIFADAYVNANQNRSFDKKTVESEKGTVSNSTKTEKIKRKGDDKELQNINTSNKTRLKHDDMNSIMLKRKRNDKESKNSDVRNKTQSKHELKNVSSISKTIKRNYRDKIKIKLFPKKINPSKKLANNGIIDLTSDDLLEVRKEGLLVNNFENKSRWHDSNKTYFLKFNSYCYPEDGTLNYSFQKLVTDVKHMKLPAPSWKIKVIIKQGKISAISFTNKLILERSVGFSVNSNRYKIIIDNKPALLLGSPQAIKSSQDLEILLDIVQNIDPKSPMVFYK